MTTPLCSVAIPLESWEYDWVRHVGTQRHEIRKDSRDAAHYDPSRMEDNLRASIAGCAAEMAVAKYHGTYWSGTYWPVADHDRFKHLPDVAPNYEVKRIREPGNPLPVRKRDVAANRTVVCAFPDPDTGFQVVYVVGEIAAVEGFERGKPASYDPFGTRLVPQAFLEFYGRIRRSVAA
jgi:hypothetical protein